MGSWPLCTKNRPISLFWLQIGQDLFLWKASLEIHFPSKFQLHSLHQTSAVVYWSWQSSFEMAIGLFAFHRFLHLCSCFKLGKTCLYEKLAWRSTSPRNFNSIGFTILLILLIGGNIWPLILISLPNPKFLPTFSS